MKVSPDAYTFNSDAWFPLPIPVGPTESNANTTEKKGEATDSVESDDLSNSQQ